MTVMSNKDHRFIKATVVMEVEVYIDELTEPEDVFNKNSFYSNSDHGRITESRLIHVAITETKQL